jgi:hypothetical protein
MTVVAQQAVTRIGARPLLIVGAAIAAEAMVWLSRITEHSTFADGMLGPELLLGPAWARCSCCSSWSG